MTCLFNHQRIPRNLGYLSKGFGNLWLDGFFDTKTFKGYGPHMMPVMVLQLWDGLHILFSLSLSHNFNLTFLISKAVLGSLFDFLYLYSSFVVMVELLCVATPMPFFFLFTECR